MEDLIVADRRTFSATIWEEKVGGSKLKYLQEYLHTEVAGKEMWQGVNAQPRSAGAYYNIQAAQTSVPLCLYAAVINTCADGR